MFRQFDSAKHTVRLKIEKERQRQKAESEEKDREENTRFVWNFWKEFIFRLLRVIHQKDIGFIYK